MFGLNKLAEKAHVVSHLIVATIKFLRTPGNPIMSHIPAVVVPEVNAVLDEVLADRLKTIAGDMSQGAAPAK